MGFREVSVFSKIAFGLALGGFSTDIVGFPTPYWVSADGASQGLFQMCTTHCVKIPSYLLAEWNKVAIACEIIGFLVCLGCFALTVLYVHVTNDKKIFQTIATGLAFAAAGFILVGVIIYGSNVSVPSFGWSFGMTIVSSLFHIGVGVANLIDKYLSL